MSAMETMITKLKTVSAVTAIVTTAKIYPTAAPQGVEPPYLVLNHIGRQDPGLLGGAGGYPETRIEIDCYGATALQAMTLGEAVLAGLGSVVKETIGGVTHVDIYAASTDFTDFNGELNTYVRTLDFYIRRT